MNYAKLIDGDLILAPRIVIYQNKRVSNPRPAILQALGYKLVQYTDPPEAPAGYHLEESWIEFADTIVQIWTLVPDEEVNEE